MSTRKFRSVGWCAAVAGAALGCYLVSHRVAAERGDLEEVEREIAEARRDLLSLDTELDTRGRMGQLERWNRDAFVLAAPRPDQFLEGEFDLALYHADAPPTIGDPAAVRQVSAPAPAREAPAADPAERAVLAELDAEALNRPAIHRTAYLVPAEAERQARAEPTAFLDDALAAELAELAEREDAPAE